MEKLNSFISNLSRAFTSCSIRGENVERQGQRVAQGLQNQVRNDDAQQAIEMAQRANEVQGRVAAFLNLDLTPIIEIAQQEQQEQRAQQEQPAQQPAAEEPVAEEPVADEPVAIHQPVAAEQQALTEQQLNEQIQNLNKKLAKKGCGEFGKDVFQLLKSINNELSNGKLVVVTQDSGLFGGTISDSKKGDNFYTYTTKDNIYPLSEPTTHETGLVRSVHLVSPLEEKFYAPHEVVKYKKNGKEFSSYENVRVAMYEDQRYYCNNQQIHKTLPLLHKFSDGTKLISLEIDDAKGTIIDYSGHSGHGDDVYDDHDDINIARSVRLCDGMTEGSISHIAFYYTGSCNEDPARGFYNSSLQKIGDFCKNYRSDNDKFNKLFELGEHAKQPEQPVEAPAQPAQQAQQPAAELDDIIDDADLEEAMEAAGMLPPAQPAAAQDSESDLPAEAPAQPVAAQQQPEQAQAADQPQQPVAAEQPEQAQQPVENANAQQPAQQPAANDNAQQAQQPDANANAQQQAQQPAANDNAQQAQQPVANDNAQPAQQAQQAQQPDGNDNVQPAQQAQQPVENANAQPAQQAQQPVENANAQQQAQQPVENANAQQPAANDNAQPAQQAQQPDGNNNAQQAQQPDGNNNAQQARAAQQNNPNPIFTARHTIGTTGYNLENAPAMNKTGFEGPHSFADYGPNYNQRIEMNSDANIEDKFVFRNIPEVKISKGDQLYTFAHERIVRVKRSGSIDQNDGQLHIDRNNNVRTNGQIH